MAASGHVENLVYAVDQPIDVVIPLPNGPIGRATMTGFISDPVDMRNNTDVCFQAAWTITNPWGGILRLQGSTDRINWVNYTGSDVVITIGLDPVLDHLFIYEVDEVTVPFIRIMLDVTSGGVGDTVSCNVSKKRR